MRYVFRCRRRVTHRLWIELVLLTETVGSLFSLDVSVPVTDPSVSQLNVHFVSVLSDLHNDGFGEDESSLGL